jgi:hypothetical protein
MISLMTSTPWVTTGWSVSDGSIRSGNRPRKTMADSLDFKKMTMPELADQLASRIRDIHGNLEGADHQHIRKVGPELESDIDKSQEIIKELTKQLEIADRMVFYIYKKGL